MHRHNPTTPDLRSALARVEAARSVLRELAADAPPQTEDAAWLELRAAEAQVRAVICRERGWVA